MIRINSIKLNSIARTCVLASAMTLIAPSVLAQSAPLPRSTVETISVSGSQRTQINEFVQGWTTKALGDKALDTKSAIEALTKPLQSRGVSVAFRQAYTQSVTPLMDELEAKDSVGAKLSALRLAGDLATPTAALRIKSALGSDDLGIQLFAVSRAGQVFNATKNYGPAITANDAKSLINAVAKLSVEPDLEPELLRSCVRALSLGTRLSSKDMGDTRSYAMVAMANAVGPILRGLSITDEPSFAHELALVAASAATAAISDISSNTTDQAVEASVGLGGDIISVTLRRVLGGTISPVSADRDMSVRSVQAGETLLYFALRKDGELGNRFGRAGGKISQTGFAELLTNGDDKVFRNKASLLLADGSPIMVGFDFPDGRFVR